ncbi:MAG: hypothetical protein J6B87_04045 [Clostridia bacterium]|nr:hypothetical protein [Clostridia bacterium]
MNEFRIWINEKYQRNKIIIWFFIIAVTMFLLVNYEIGEVRDSSKTTISENTSANNVQVLNKIHEIASDNKDKDYNQMIKELDEANPTKENYIELFIELCNAGKCDSAYELLSDNCKSTLYPTVEDFIKNYYSVIFKTNKNYKIISFKNDTYKVAYYESAIYSGKEQTEGIQDYITIDGVAKLNISKFIQSKEMDVLSVSPYCSFKVTKKETFMDYEMYTVVVKNNTKADIYVNDVTNSNLYIQNSQGNVFYIDSGEYFDQKYLVPAGNEKELKLKFNIKYEVENRDNVIEKMCFGNMKIINKEYIDDTAMTYDSATGQYIYETRKTKYPQYDSHIVVLENKDELENDNE